MRQLIAVMWTGFFALTLGCGQRAPKPAATTAPKLAASKLTVLVIDDPGITAGLKLLRGEWAERSGGELELQAGSVEDLLAGEKLTADMVIYPSRYVGTLVERDWVRPVRKSVLESEDVAMDDFLPLIRNSVLPYGGQVYALTLGEAPLMLSGKQLSSEDFATWESLAAPLEAGSSPLKFPHAVEFFMRGTAYAESRSQSAGWFDADSLEPKITEAPFVKALEQMIAAKRSSDPSKPSVAIAWPTASKDNAPESSTFVPVPGAKQVFNPVRNVWEDNESEQPLVFLGYAGRSMSVARSTRNSASAFKLLKWLANENISTQLSARSQTTVWFRRSQSSKAKKWLPDSADREGVAQSVTQLLSSGKAYLLPRIPGIDDYLQMVEDSVEQAISGQSSAEEALATVAQAWNGITDRYGRERQRVAYRRHLGLDSANN